MPVRVEAEHGGERLVVSADRELVVVEVAPAFHASRGTKPTFFELITAMAFLHFDAKDVDIAVIEAGLDLVGLRRNEAELEAIFVRHAIANPPIEPTSN